MENKMFCYQCQETANCSGCTVSGVCGKKPDVAAMQDLLVYATKGLSAVAEEARAEGKEVSPDLNHRVTMNLFITITNANFDKDAIVDHIKETFAMRDAVRATLSDSSKLPKAATVEVAEKDYEIFAQSIGVLSTENEDIRS